MRRKRRDGGGGDGEGKWGRGQGEGAGGVAAAGRKPHKSPRSPHLPRVVLRVIVQGEGGHLAGIGRALDGVTSVLALFLPRSLSLPFALFLSQCPFLYCSFLSSFSLCHYFFFLAFFLRRFVRVGAVVRDSADGSLDGLDPLAARGSAGDPGCCVKAFLVLCWPHVSAGPVWAVSSCLSLRLMPSRR